MQKQGYLFYDSFLEIGDFQTKVDNAVCPFYGNAPKNGAKIRITFSLLKKNNNFFGIVL
jgi:hypothetical protein